MYYSAGAIYKMVKRRSQHLIHHGIKGQKWGIRNGPPYPLKKNKNYVIVDPNTKQEYRLAEGANIQNPNTFAGKGTSKPLKEAVKEGLTNELGGDPEKWQHRKGITVIDYNGEERKAEIHWFQEETVGKHKFKIKRWID